MKKFFLFLFNPWLAKFFFRAHIGARFYMGDEQGNKIDFFWGSFVKTKDSGDFRALIELCKSVEPDVIKDSRMFGVLIRDIYDSFMAYMGGRSGSLKKNLSGLVGMSSSYKTVLGWLFIRFFEVRYLSHREYRGNSVLRDELARRGVCLASIDFISEWLSKSDLEKYEFICSSVADRKLDGVGSINFLGTSYFGSCFLRARMAFGYFYIVSLRTPFDGIYLPQAECFIRSDTIFDNFRPGVDGLLKWILKDPEGFLAGWSEHEVVEVVNLIKVDRPYHVLADELSGNFRLNARLGRKVPVAILDRAAFVEESMISDFSAVALSDTQAFGFDKVLFSSYSRVRHEKEWSVDYKNWLIDLALKGYKESLPKKNEPWLWLSIGGGEKRKWYEELDGLVATIRWWRMKHPKSRIVIDGWTLSANVKQHDVDRLREHEDILSRVLSCSGLDVDDASSLIGCRVFQKIAYAANCDFFVSSSGTPAFWPSGICGVPGVVHNSKAMLSETVETFYGERCIIVPFDEIVDVKEAGGRDRWDYTNYHISPESIVGCCELAYSRFSII